MRMQLTTILRPQVSLLLALTAMFGCAAPPANPGEPGGEGSGAGSARDGGSGGAGGSGDTDGNASGNGDASNGLNGDDSNAAPDGAAEDAGSSGNGEGGPTPTADAGLMVSCAPTMSGMRGLTMQNVMVGGAARTYLMYLPPTLDPNEPAPLLFVFHGSTMTGQQMHDITGLSELADSEGFAVVFPDGQGAPIYLAPWNVENTGQAVCGAGQLISAPGDDFGFMDAMKANVTSFQCVDTRHVFATGFSMGGYFSHHAGCYRDDVRAIAAHSGGTTASLADCTTGHVPAIIFHGTMDNTIAPGCDDPNAAPQSGFPPSATLWAQKNGCAATYTTVSEASDGGGAGQCYVYDGCPADGQVELCTFTGMGHCWAGGSTAGQGGLSACPSYPSATQLEWSFFKRYAW